MSMLGGRSLIPTNYYFWGRGGVRGGGGGLLVIFIPLTNHPQARGVQNTVQNM